MRAVFLPLAALALVVAGCEATPGTSNSPGQRTELQSRAKTALDQMLSTDSHLRDVINNSTAYAIFPEVGKAAVGVGGAGGQGVVYQNGQPIGTVKMDQVGVGPQLGGETYSELVVFQDQAALNRLMNNNLQFGAQASATIVKAGAAAAAPFEQGVATYILPKGGLMAGADIHGQKFTYYGNNGM